MTALAQAVRERRWRQARLLIDIGSSVNGKGEHDRTPLIEMCYSDNQEKAAALANILLEKGANVDAKDEEGRTALSIACLLHRTKLFPLLIKYVDYDLNSADNEGNTALFHAITAGDIDIVKKLIAKMLHFGLKVDVMNAKGETPLIYSLKSKKLDIAEVLIKDGKASLEACDLEFQKSASQWKQDLTRSDSNSNLPSLFLKALGEQKMQTESRKNKLTTGSASRRLDERRRERLPMIARPTTAPDRIVVPEFLRPCVPIKTSLGKLYMIYNQQTTDSFRYGYTPVKYKEPINDNHNKQRSSKSGVTFNQVNELTIKLQGLYKDSIKRNSSGSASSSKGRGNSSERPALRSVAKGTKVMKSFTKSMQQLD